MTVTYHINNTYPNNILEIENKRLDQIDLLICLCLKFSNRYYFDYLRFFVLYNLQIYRMSYTSTEPL